MKNKIQYVRVLDYDKGDWYEELAISKAIIEVTESQISKIDYACVQDYMHRLIRKVHCEPVQMKELDKDIDGNYLECGDEVLCAGTKDVYIFIAQFGNGYVLFDDAHDSDEDGFWHHDEKVRKIPKEEKKVDPIEEEINKFENYAECHRTTNELCHFAIDTIHKIKQHMEDKKG